MLQSFDICPKFVSQEIFVYGMRQTIKQTHKLGSSSERGRERQREKEGENKFVEALGREQQTWWDRKDERNKKSVKERTEWDKKTTEKGEKT